jgi:hypothetical protein
MVTSSMHHMKMESIRTSRRRVSQSGWKWKKKMKVAQMETLMRRRWTHVSRKFGETSYT